MRVGWCLAARLEDFHHQRERYAVGERIEQTGEVIAVRWGNTKCLKLRRAPGDGSRCHHFNRPFNMSADKTVKPKIWRMLSKVASRQKSGFVVAAQSSIRTVSKPRKLASARVCRTH